MKLGSTFKYSIVLGWLVSTLAIVIVAALVVSAESRSDYFWYRIVWAGLLNVLLWLSASFYILATDSRKDSGSRYGGITPTISIVTMTYVVLSIGGMIIHAFVPEGETASRVHWIFQIIIFSAATLIIVFLSISRAGATSGSEFDQTKALTPKELHDLLAVQESSLSSNSLSELSASIKQLREVLRYSLHESKALSTHPEYQEVSQDVIALCKLMMELSGPSEQQADQFTSLKQAISVLITKTEMVATQQIIR